MKWYHLPILVSIGVALIGVEQRFTLGSASVWIVLLAVPGIIYVSSKSLEFVFRNRL